MLNCRNSTRPLESLTVGVIHYRYIDHDILWRADATDYLYTLPTDNWARTLTNF